MHIHQRPIAQGEIEFFAVTPDHFDTADVAPLEPQNGAYIVAHSESGHHHVIDRARAEVCTVKTDMPGMTILRLIVTDPDGADVVNLNPTGHKPLRLAPGIYEGRISREMGMDDVLRSSRD